MAIIDLFIEGDLKLPYAGMTSAWLKSISADGCSALDLGNVSVTIILCDDERIREINRDFRGKDKPTDVISFAYRDEPFPQPIDETELLGDIYISLETALAQSREYEITFTEEMSRLVVHALCHLVGYDHETSAKDEAIMREKEDEVLLKLTTSRNKPPAVKKSSIKKKNLSDFSPQRQ